MGVLILIAVLAQSVGQWLDPLVLNVSNRYQPPSMSHPFGTDALGRDMLARTLYATGLSLKVVTYALVIAAMLAWLFGSIAGYFCGRWPDKIISWAIAFFMSVPAILIVVGLFSVITPTFERLYIVIGMLAWAQPARLVRATVAQVRASEFVTAERAFGYGWMHITFYSLFVLAMPPILLSLLLAIPELITIEIGLSFFGLGASPPTPTLGRMIFDGLSSWHVAWWVAVAPAATLALLLTALYVALNRFGPRVQYG